MREEEPFLETCRLPRVAANGPALGPGNAEMLAAKVAVIAVSQKRIMRLWHRGKLKGDVSRKDIVLFKAFRGLFVANLGRATSRYLQPDDVTIYGMPKNNSCRASPVTPF